MPRTLNHNALTTRRNHKDNAVVAKQPRRQADWVLVDISGSTAAQVKGLFSNENGPRRIDCINEALNNLGTDVEVIAFSDGISRERVGEYTPQGSTNFCPAFLEVQKWEPTTVIVISDGEITDSKDECLGLAKKAAQSAVIDTIYIGPDDSNAEAFMRELAEIGHGRFRKYESSKLSEKVQTLLPPPAEAIVVKL